MNSRSAHGTLLERIRRRFRSVLRKRCSEKGCELRLHGLTDYVILNGDRLCQDRKMCDCIIFSESDDLIVGIVELKSRTVHANEVIDKLTNASEIAVGILESANRRRLSLQMYHLVLAKRWSTSEYEVVRHRRITVRGRRHYVIPKRCGISFPELIASLQ